jgi:hypothetical protein
MCCRNHTHLHPAAATTPGGAFLELRPHSYLFAAGEPGTYCLGLFDNGPSGTLLGGIITRDTLVQVCVCARV